MYLPSATLLFSFIYVISVVSVSIKGILHSKQGDELSAGATFINMV